MLKPSAIVLAILAVNPAPVFAQDTRNTQCGRWVSCPPGPHINLRLIKSYIYGNSRDVEPWIPMEKPARKKEAPQPAPDSPNPPINASNVISGVETAPSAKSPVELLVAPADINSDSPFNFSPAEEVAVRAYLDEIDKERGPKNVFDIGVGKQPIELNTLSN